tara:strand:+ start:14658 stop:16796 length:2139 start_codon:yes stop_codon:yes gene_type:complete
MTKDKSNTPKGRYNTRSSKKKDDKKNYKKGDSSDSSSSEESDYSSSDERHDGMDEKEYKKFLSKLFPSSHMKKQLAMMDEVDSKSSKKSPKKSSKKSSKKSPKKSRKPKKKSKKEDSESEEEEYDDEEEFDEDDLKELKEQMSFTIVIGGPNMDKEDEMYDSDEDEDEDSDSEYEEESEEEESEEEDSVEDEESEEEESEEESDDDEGEGEEPKKGKSLKKSKKVENDVKDNKNKKEEKSDEDDEEVLKKFKDFVGRYKEKSSNNKILKEFEKVTKKEEKKLKVAEDKKNKKEKVKNAKEFVKLVKEKNVMNDLKYFKELKLVEQKKIIKKLQEINDISKSEKPYRIALIDSQISAEYKASAMRKINSLRYMEPGSGEYYKIKNWVDTFMGIPFGTYKTFDITVKDGPDVCHDYMKKAQSRLDEAVYGLNDAKLQIMQMIGQWITNPQAVGNAIAIKGPMGTGKTTLVKEGVSAILNRPFAFLALGGATDSSFLEGHSYTYEGSTWGKIVDILIKSKCMNPVIYFDELDKVSNTPKGDEIIGILTHLIDTTQNTQFHDKYFADIDFDLSKALFIFSYNDESKINPILLDRMYRITTKGYNKKEKCTIANNYVTPSIAKNISIGEKDIDIPEDTLHYIIEQFTNKEEGVRNLKRCVEIIYTKVNLFRLMKPDENLFEKDIPIKVSFPFTVTREIVDKLLKEPSNDLNKYNLYI